VCVLGGWWQSNILQLKTFNKFPHVRQSLNENLKKKYLFVYPDNIKVP